MENLYTIEKLFSERLFRVPDYQRGYAWEIQQCQEFMEDLALLEAEKQHFLGTLILHNRNAHKIVDRSGSSYAEYDIVDGQQRLTTLVILFQVINQFMVQSPDLQDLADGLRQKYLVGEDRNKRPLPKLSLNEDSRAFFNQVVLGTGAYIQGPTIRSHERLRAAKIFFTKYLEDKKAALAETFDTWLEALFFKLIQRLTLIVYAVEREADAGIIFETMNNRGKPITELEKVKNYLLYLAGKLHLPAEHALVATINHTWKHIFESLMTANLGSEDNENQLLRAHWLMAYDPQTKNWKGSRSIKERFNLRDYAAQHPVLLADIHTYLDSLHNGATAYRDILRPTRPGAFQNFQGQAIQKKISAEAGKLARVGSLASFLPLLMALRIQYPTDGPNYVAAVQLCEKYAFRVYRWLRLRSNAGQSRLFRLGYQLFQQQTSINEMKNSLAQMILNYAPDNQFEAKFADEENWYQWSGLKYYLYEYESYLAQKKGVPVKMPYEDIARKKDTIEHILPGTPDKVGYWRKHFPGQTYQRWLNDIGNLTLTYMNSELSNRPFNTIGKQKGKKEYYTDSDLLMERRLARFEDWTIENIQMRRETLKEWTLERWRIEKPEVISEDNEPVAEGPTMADYRLVLTRSPVPRGQKQLYQALYDAGESGLTNDELVRIMGRRNRQDLAGVLGVLGRRVNETAGYGRMARPGMVMLLTTEPANGNQKRYFLRPETRQVLEELDAPWLQEMVK